MCSLPAFAVAFPTTKIAFSLHPFTVSFLQTEEKKPSSHHNKANNLWINLGEKGGT